MSDTDSDAPEEFTAHQGMQQDEEIIKVQRENKARVAREGKERRRQWAQKLTPKSPPKVKSTKIAAETKKYKEEGSQVNKGMLPDNIVEILAAREKKVFTSDSEDEEEADKKPTSKKRKAKKTGLEPVILTEIPPAPCVQNSLEFLKKRKMMVSRSSAVLNNPSKSFRLMWKTGLLR